MLGRLKYIDTAEPSVFERSSFEVEIVKESWKRINH
jgi:hypothetical protein